MQRRVDAVGSQFAESVAKFYGKTVEAVRAEFGDGEVFLAGEALSRGMIDSIGSFNISTAKLTTNEKSESPIVETSTAEPQSVKIEITKTKTENNDRDQNVVVETERRNESPTERNETESSGGSTITPKRDEMKFSKKVKNAFYVFNMTNDSEANDDVCSAALNAFCLAKGVDVPGEDATEKEILAIINPNAKPANSDGPGSGDSTPTNQTTEQKETAKEQRTDALNQAVKTFAAAGVEIPAAKLTEAIESNKSVDEIVSSWGTIGGKQHEENSLPGQLRHTESSDDKFHVEAVNRIMEIANCPMRLEGGSEVSTMRNWSAEHVFQESMSRMGTPHERGGSWEIDFTNAIGQGSSVGSRRLLQESSAVSGYNKPSDLSAIVGRSINLFVDDGMDQKETTYEQWTGRIPDTNTLDPTQMYAISDATTLDQVVGMQAAKEFAIEQELLGHLFVTGFRNFIAVSWEMGYANNIAVLYEKIMAMGGAIKLTDQALCLKVLTSTENYSDTGNPLFHSSRGNYFATGGTAAAPSDAQAEVHENAFINRKGVGTNAKRLNLRPAIALVPTDQKQPGRQTYDDPASFKELISKNANANISTHRGTVEVIVEPDLNDFDAKAWYTMTDPKRRPAIVRQYLSGHGTGGRRTQALDPDTGAMKYYIEHAAGAGVKNWRYINKDDGQ